MMIEGGYGMKLLKANLSTGLFLRITVDNPTIVMIQRRKTSCLPIIGLQEVVVDMLMTMKGMVVIFD